MAALQLLGSSGWFLGCCGHILRHC